jgi:hypothetical protein
MPAATAVEDEGWRGAKVAEFLQFLIALVGIPVTVNIDPQCWNECGSFCLALLCLPQTWGEVHAEALTVECLRLLERGCQFGLFAQPSPE